MDQFATGLTGTRTPYGALRERRRPALHRRAARARARRSSWPTARVPFALGTDTAGSGRVPAAFNAHRRPQALARAALHARRRARLPQPGLRLAADRATSPTPRACSPSPPGPTRPIRTRARPPRAAARAPRRGAARGSPCPRADALTFAGDRGGRAAWQHALRRASALGWELTEIDFAPFAEAAALLYGGPVGGRALRRGRARSSPRIPADVDPVVREVIMAGRDIGAVRGLPGRAPPARAARCERRGLASRPTRCCCRPRRRSSPPPRSPRSRSRATRCSAPTRTSSTCSTSARSRCPPAGAPTGCRSASR